MNDKGKSLHNEASCAILLWRVAFRVGLNRPNSFSRCLLEIRSQAELSALIKGDGLREFVFGLGVDDDLLHC